MESKGYALAFVMVMGIICLGMYVAVSALRANSQPLIRIARPTERTLSAVPDTLATPSPPPATPSPPPPTETPQPPIALPPQASPTATPASANQSPLPSPTATVPVATPTTYVSYAFVPNGPVKGDFTQGCTGGAYIFGFVRDANGNLLEGVRIQASDAWGNHLPAITKGGADLGKYDVPISHVANSWNVTVTDAQGSPLSPVVSVYHSGNYIPGQEPCWHRLNWRRTH